jgi:DNA-binding transcriptional MerR regulator
LRYYERIRLIEPIRRAPNGHRCYTQEDIDWISLLMHLKETGMPLAQMVRFAQMRRQGPSTLLTERRIMLEHHQHVLEQQIQRLEQHKAVLQQKIATYKEREARSADPSSSALSSDTTSK